MNGIIPGSDAVFRVLFSLIFVGAGIRHLVRPDEIVARLVAAPLGYLATSIAPATLLVTVTGAILVPAGAALMLGYRTRIAAFVLLLVLVPITITVDVGHTGALGPLFKNIALLGGLVHFVSKGGGDWSLDRRTVREVESGAE